MKKYLLCIALVSSFLVASTAQKDQTIFGKRGICLTGVWGGSTHSISTFGQNLDITKNGYFVFEFSKKVLIGWEHLNTQYSNIAIGNTKLKSNGFAFGYSPWAHKAFHPVFSLYGGGGKIFASDLVDSNVQIWQPSVDLELNIFRWFKVGADVGYRFVSNTDIAGITDELLSGPYAGLKLKFGWSWGR